MSIDLEQQPWPKLYQAAEFAIAQDRWLAAEPLLEHCLRQNPQHAAAHHLLGKVFRQQQRLEAALQAQQQSCQLDPALGWNWFSAGELMMKLKRFTEAAEAFEQALHVLPTEGWIRDQVVGARLADRTGGECLSEGLGAKTYQFWIEEHETRLPSGQIPTVNSFWLLESRPDGSQRWSALHASSDLQPSKAPLGDSPWPTDGWLVLLGDGAALRTGAVEAVESWLAGGLDDHKVAQYIHQFSPLIRSHLDQPDLIYSDEDRLDEHGKRFDPWLKPDWVEESFWSSPWLSSLSVWRMSWLRNNNLPLPPADPTSRWEWLLTALSKNPSVSHIPLFLVHRLSPVELDPAPLVHYLNKIGESVKSVEPHPDLEGCFSLHWAIPLKWSCTIIIPTRDHADLLRRCLESIWRTTECARISGCDLEIIIIDNGSIELETEHLLKSWSSRVNVVRIDDSFNWSRLNNQATRLANGEIILFLNNDVEAIKSGWLEAMASHVFRPCVGAVGAILTYPDGSIQHGGVVVGMHSGADNAYRNLPLDNNVHRGRSRLLTAWGALTGACLMIRKDLLYSLGGIDEGFPVEFNDVDLCLQLGQAGLRCVVPPQAILIHHESQSRNTKQSKTSLEALRRIQNRWGQRFSNNSPWWPLQSSRNHPDGRLLGIEYVKLRSTV